jgi:ubiquinone/menaquinone biosynthesis C-methylase UbiE
MRPIFWQSQLTTFLLYCNGTELEKKILDCGAGGRRPPLAIFKDQGYETMGLEISDQSLERTREFESEFGYDLHIQKGDLREIPLKDESMSFVYSYNTIFHLPKAEIKAALHEFNRVIKPGGLCFINLLTTEDHGYGEGEEIRPGEFQQEEMGEQVLHCYHKKDEAEAYFAEAGFDVVYKEIRKRIGPSRAGGKITLGYVDYIVEKIKKQ